MNHLSNAIKRHARELDDQRGQPRWGIVQSVDPSAPAVKVTIQPEGIVTGWLPVLHPVAGGQWGMYALPPPGTMVKMIPDLGDANHYTVIGAAHNDRDRPASVPAAINGTNGHAMPGEIMFVSRAGAVLRLAADGSIYMRGNVNIQGDLKVSGQISDLNGAHQTLDALRQAYNQHDHTRGVGTTTRPIP